MIQLHIYPSHAEDDPILSLPVVIRAITHAMRTRMTLSRVTRNRQGTKKRGEPGNICKRKQSTLSITSTIFLVFASSPSYLLSPRIERSCLNKIFVFHISRCLPRGVGEGWLCKYEGNGSHITTYRWKESGLDLPQHTFSPNSINGSFWGVLTHQPSNISQLIPLPRNHLSPDSEVFSLPIAFRMLVCNSSPVVDDSSILGLIVEDDVKYFC